MIELDGIGGNENDHLLEDHSVQTQVKKVLTFDIFCSCFFEVFITVHSTEERSPITVSSQLV
jgi:hypothetical protein